MMQPLVTIPVWRRHNLEPFYSCYFYATADEVRLLFLSHKSAKEEASKLGQLHLFQLLATLLAEGNKGYILEKCVIYTPGVGEGRSDSEQVHSGKTVG